MKNYASTLIASLSNLFSPADTEDQQSKEACKRFYLNKLTPEEVEYETTIKSKGKIIPKNAVLPVAITGGFVAVERYSGIKVCIIDVVVTEGEFFGQKYKYKARIFDKDLTKVYSARQNLLSIDSQVGFPMTKSQDALTTESIEEHWVGLSPIMVKFGLFLTKPEDELDGQAREINFIDSFI